MKSGILIFCCLWSSLLTASASVVTWDGGGDDTNWNNALNWSGDFVPTTTNDVVLGPGAAVTIAGNFTILSVQSQRPLSLSSGTLAVTAGASEVTETLTLSPNATLTANGATVTFIATNSVNVNGGNLFAFNGAKLRLPGLRTASKIDGCYDTTWQASGSGSVLDVSALTNLYGGNCFTMRLQAISGGQVIVSNLVSMANGFVLAFADGAGSVLDLRNLPAFPSTDRWFDVEARNSAQIIMPLLVDGLRTRIVLRNGGMLDTAQFTRLGSVTVDNVTLTLPAVTNVDGINLFVFNGGRLALPQIRKISKTDGCYDMFWQATGSGSVLDLSTVTNAYGGDCFNLRVIAQSGGQVVASNLVSLTNGFVQVTADGTGSTVDLRNLPAFPSTNRLFELDARNNGRIILPLLTDGRRVRIAVRTGGMLDTAQLQRVESATADNAVLTLLSVTNVDGVSLFALNGGRLSLPLITSISKTDGCYDMFWQATGAGSVLDLSTVTKAYGGDCFNLRVIAQSGGQVVASNLVSLTNGFVQVTADGAGSVVDLRNLPAFPSTNRLLELDARNNGRIILPLLTDGRRVRVAVRTGGVLDTTQLQRVESATADNAVLTLSSVTNVDGINLFAFNGGRLSLPLITSISKTDGCYDMFWQASGAGSVLDLSTVTNAYGGNCLNLRVIAQSGGQVIVSNLVFLTNGFVQVTADGAGSIADFRNLPAFPSVDRWLDLEARNNGTIIAPLLVDGSRVRITVRAGGMLDTAQFTRLGSVTLDNSTLNLTGVTNLDGAPITVIAGGKLTLPALQSSTKAPGCFDVHWQASGAGSRLEAPVLARLNGGSCSTFFLEALSGGRLVLSNVVSLSGSAVAVLADGNASVIDLSRLASFIGPSAPPASLVARNGGVVLLGTQAFLLANVTVNIPPGNPVLPPAFISGPNLTLYGMAWHSYLIEQSSTLAPEPPWEFFARAPLTNSFQQISGPPPPNTAFRATEFVANPSRFDVFPNSNPQQFVFYGLSTQMYLIQTTTNLADSLWTTNSVVVMTNSFRLLPLISPVEPIRFFRAREL